MDWLPTGKVQLSEEVDLEKKKDHTLYSHVLLQFKDGGQDNLISRGSLLFLNKLNEWHNSDSESHTLSWLSNNELSAACVYRRKEVEIFANQASVAGVSMESTSFF